MKTAPTTSRNTRGGNVYDQLAAKLKEMVQAEHLNNGSGAERFTVRSVSPLIIEHVHHDLTLEDGDPDLTVGAWIRQYILDYGLVAGDQVWCLREGSEWHVVDVSDPGQQEPWSFVGHTHSDPQGGTSGPGPRHSPTLGS